MLTRSRTTQFLIASALTFAGSVAPLSAANATVSPAPNGTAVAVGQSHVSAIDSTGKVWTWGRIYPGNGGSGTWDTITRPEEVTRSGVSFSAVSISASEQSTLVATTAGEVYAWGYNGNGLGNGSGFQSPRSTPVRVSFPAGVQIVEVAGSCNGYLARSSQGAVYQWGAFYGMWNLSSSTPVIALAAGSVSGEADKKLLSRGCSSAFAVKADGSFFAWGSNGGGKLGNGSTSDLTTPVSVTISGKSVTQLSASSTHTLARTSDGFVYAWGGNSNGQLARNPSSTSFISTPARVGTISNAVSVSASDSSPYSSIVSSTGSVSNWGSYFGMGSDTNAYTPTVLTSPPDLSTQIVSGTGYQDGQAFVGQDGSIWTRGLYANDGNCGADANSYSTWINGRMQPPRTLVRVFSAGQFGTTYVEDELAINSLKMSDGSVLRLDGSGLISVLAGDSISLVASRPSSNCFNTSDLLFAWDLDGDGVFSDEAVVTTDSFDNALVTGSTTLETIQSRSTGGLKITNTDGYSKVFEFDVRVTAPSQNIGSVDDELPYVGTGPGDFNGQNLGVAIGTNGKLYAWGSEDLAGTDATSPVQLQTDPALSFVKTSSKLYVYDSNGQQTSYGAAAALTSDGQIYAWGRGPSAKNVDSSSETLLTPIEFYQENPALIVPPDASDPAVDFALAGDNLGFAVTESGKVWVWGGSYFDWIDGQEVKNVIPPRFISAFIGTSKIQSNGYGESLQLMIDGVWSTSDIGNLFERVNDDMDQSQIVLRDVVIQALDVPIGSTKIFQIGDEYAGLVNGSWIVNDSELDSPSSSPIKQIREKHGELLVLTNDGALWRGYLGNNWSDVEWDSFKDAGSAIRFAGPETNAWIASDGSINGGGGACDASGWSDSSDLTMHSDGNLGPANSDDGIEIYLTAENAVDNVVGNPSYVHAYAEKLEGAPYTFGNSNGGGGGESTLFSSALQINPTNSQEITISVGSDCVARSNLNVSLDLDDDGEFETDSSLSAVTTSKYPTRSFSFTASAKRGETVVSDLDFSNPGGSYIGVRVESTNVYNNGDYTSTVRLPIVVEPVRPTARYSGVSINRGAEFTESADVTLSLAWPAGAITADISNDGGFERSQNVPLGATTNWRLSDLTSGKIGSSVYVKFLGLQATAGGSWQEVDIQPGPAYSDNITMDLTPPVVSTAEASVVNSQSTALRMVGDFASKIRSLISAQSIEAQSVEVQNARVTIGASDAGSGVTSMQITSDPAIPGPELPYQSSITMPVVKDTVAVRVKDNVGNWSTWRFVRVSGFQPIVEVPNPAPNNPAPNPAPNPIPAAPVQLQIAPKAKVSSGAVAASLGAVIPAKSKVTLTVSKASKKICKVSGGKLVAIKPGNCSVTVTVQPPKPKKGKKPKALKTSGIVKIN